MWWKKGVCIVLILFLISVACGIIYINNSISGVNAGSSQFKIYCTKDPLQVIVQTEGYNIYLFDGNFFSDIKDGITISYNKISDGVKNEISKLTGHENKENTNRGTDSNDTNNNDSYTNLDPN